ncbi:hypothetical protein B0H14DRAFT_2850165 [Mycena olivaceomarginata]|nr:hypothetical protein B0H14DRAFT_2850165 [Mycena olivaceomarginata]
MQRDIPSSLRRFYLLHIRSLLILFFHSLLPSLVPYSRPTNLLLLPRSTSNGVVVTNTIRVTSTVPAGTTITPSTHVTTAATKHTGVALLLLAVLVWALMRRARERRKRAEFDGDFDPGRTTAGAGPTLPQLDRVRGGRRGRGEAGGERGGRGRVDAIYGRHGAPAVVYPRERILRDRRRVRGRAGAAEPVDDEHEPIPRVVVRARRAARGHRERERRVVVGRVLPEPDEREGARGARVGRVRGREPRAGGPADGADAHADAREPGGVWRAAESALAREPREHRHRERGAGAYGWGAGAGAAAGDSADV